MTRKFFLERILIQVYGDNLRDDAVTTYNLANSYLNDGIALAAKQNYTDAVALDGVGYVNNSFYTTFKGLSVAQDENFIFKVTLPQLPFGIGENEGVSTIQFKDSDGNLSLPILLLSENQKTLYHTMRPIPNKLLAYPQGEFIYVISATSLLPYTATVTMVSGGDSTNLNSTLNIPDDYMKIAGEYVARMLMAQRGQPQDVTNDGSDIK